MPTASTPKISKRVFVEILQDNTLVRPEDLRIFQALYSRDREGASPTDLAKIIGWANRNGVIGRVVGLGKRILKKYDIEQTERKDGTRKYWDFFFTGYQKDSFFIYQLKTELKEALEECGLTEPTEQMSLQKTYLFAWNPNKWSQWKDPNNEPYIESNIEELKRTGKVTLPWNCSSHKSVRPGDRAFLVRVGKTPRGIFGSGTIASEPTMAHHWNRIAKVVPQVFIEFDVLLNPDKEPILTADKLSEGSLSSQTWTPQSSGIIIKQEIACDLEEKWFTFLTTEKLNHNPFSEMRVASQTFIEGKMAQVIQTRYERNTYARKQCLDNYGFSCSVCDFNFEEFYGSLGREFTHVHHLTQVAARKAEYQIDPIQDLRPVCPNCHSMLHKRNPPLTIEELKAMTPTHRRCET